MFNQRGSRRGVEEDNRLELLRGSFDRGNVQEKQGRDEEKPQTIKNQRVCPALPRSHQRGRLIPKK